MSGRSAHWPWVLLFALPTTCRAMPPSAADRPARIAVTASLLPPASVAASGVWPPTAAATRLRDPFAWPVRKPSLADYPPQRLSMVGSFQRGRQLEALLQDPLGRIYRVHAGMRLGPRQTEVLAVDPQAVHLRLPGATGQAAEASIPLQIAAEP